MTSRSLLAFRTRLQRRIHFLQRMLIRITHLLHRMNTFIRETRPATNREHWLWILCSIDSSLQRRALEFTTSTQSVLQTDWSAVCISSKSASESEIRSLPCWTSRRPQFQHTVTAYCYKVRSSSPASCSGRRSALQLLPTWMQTRTRTRTATVWPA